MSKRTYQGKYLRPVPPSDNKFAAYLKGLFRYRDLLKQLVSRDIKLKYRRSFLGYLWSILNPLLIMIVMAMVFSQMFSRNIDNFPVYLFCGQLLFNYMNNATHQAIFSITSNASLLKKTYVPKYIFTMAKITSGLLDLVFSMGALVIVIIITKARLTWYALLAPFVLLQLYVFCMGLGLFLAQANVFFRDIQYIYNAVTTAWMYLTPIFYPIETLPDMLGQAIKTFNPMYFYVAQFRDLIYVGKMPELSLIASGFAACVLMMVIGLLCFNKSKDRFILYI